LGIYDRMLVHSDGNGGKTMGACRAVAVLVLGVAALVTGSVPAFAVVGVGLDGQGLPFLRANQVAQCPGESGDGRYVKSWRNGKKQVRGNCHAGLYVGSWSSWHENGRKKWTGRLEGGRFEGTFRSWHDNGVKWVKGTFRGGLKDGWFKFWHDSGQLAAEGEYIEDAEAGCWVQYYADGGPRSKGAYAEGEKVGKWFYWDDQGNRRKEKYGGEATQGACLIML
jgi:hypothetical protein